MRHTTRNAGIQPQSSNVGSRDGATPVMLCSAAFLPGQGKDRHDSPVVTTGMNHDLSLSVRIGRGIGKI